ncbi:UNVERIFIED_CONTAM: hypothetical protein Sangu_3194100 [Sesamum angustifolium]|uniref:Reverse transcriptase n=1 Tax=Sesamum angustifolium TaxID=2727405 RepID=A0AAW2JMA1_9LAMI
MHTSCLISVLYGDYDIIPRRTLWGALCSLSAGITDEPWLVLGDFNAVVDDSEVCGRAADTSASMLELGGVFSVAVNLEITMLKQRAKLRWMKHGDQSSKVFFRKINASRVKQRVFQIKTVGGNLLTAQQDVTQEFISYFQNLLGGTSQNRGLNLEFLRSELKHSVTTTEASLLVAPVTQAEVKEAFFDIDVESAPGPDGYTAAFYRTAWPVVGQAVFQAVGEFFRTGNLLKQINTTLIVLIPKVNLPIFVSDYRPISCCNVLYKAITKILVKRMQRVLPLLIDYFTRMAFVILRDGV